MRYVMMIILVMMSCSNSLSAKKNEPSADRDIASSAEFDRAKRNSNNCNWNDADLNCWDNLIFIISGHIGRREYSEASRYINPMRKVMTGNGSMPPNPCPFRAVTINKTHYHVGFHETVYKILNGMKSPAAEKHALRAFLCASHRNSNYKDSFMVHDDIKYFSRKNFINYFSKKNDGDKYDIQIYLDEVIEKVIMTRRKVFDDNKMYVGHIKSVALYKNAAKQCEKLGLSPEFSKFFSELSVYETHNAKEMEPSK